MKKLFALIFTLCLAFSASFNAPVAKADWMMFGHVVEIEKVYFGSDNYNAFHGFVLLSGNNSIAYWGGTRCPSSTFGSPSTSDIQLLGDAMLKGTDVTISYKTASSGFRCITGIVFTPNVI